jgi:hypothetical protein
MKKIYVTLFAIIFAVNFSFAQWYYTGGVTMYNTNTGNVGIGTTSPNASLEVNGTIRNTSPTQSVFTNTVDVISGSSGANLFTSTANAQVSIGTGITSGNVKIGPSTGGITVLGSGSGGKVGIGTTSPGSQLDVFHPGTGTALRVGGNATGTSNDAGIDLYANNSGNIPAYARIALGVSTASVGSESGYLNFSTINSGSLTEKMRITKEGNVLINQTTQFNAVYKLDVLGYVRANEIVVNVTGADFVFNPTYKLSTLSNLKKYINKNHHLPEIPSAATMVKDGLSVGDNQVKLLQKVEELTLYIIEKDKQLKQQEDRLKKIEAQLNALTNQKKH